MLDAHLMNVPQSQFQSQSQSSASASPSMGYLPESGHRLTSRRWLKTAMLAAVSSLAVLSSLDATAMSPAAADKKVQLDVAVGTPVVPAGSAQRAYVRIALTGFEREQEAERVPANVAIVLDKSGSMGGEKIARAREAAILAVQRMAADDVLSIVTYSNTVDVLFPAQAVGNGKEAIRRIRKIRDGGGTALFAGVAKGAKEVRSYLDAERVNRVILLSDGLANVGPSTPQELGELGSSLAGEGISVTTIGLGLGYNEDLMTQLAGFSDGNHAFVQNADDLIRIFAYEFGEVMSVVAQDVEIQINCAEGVKPLRLLGRPGSIEGQRVTTKVSQLLSAQEKYVVLEVEVPAGTDGSSQSLASVDVAYLNLNSRQRDALDDKVAIGYSRSEKRVKAAVNPAVQVQSLSLTANEASKEALQLRDAGKVEEAKEVLRRQASALGSAAMDLPASAPADVLRELSEQAAEFEQDAADFDDEKNWNRNRKSLKAKQYKKDRQQTY